MSKPLLLIDNSNTRTKFALAAPGGELMHELRTCPTADISADTLRRTLEGWSYEGAVLCSVAPQAAAILRAELSCPITEISSASCPHFLRGYGSPQSLGADRIANAAAVATHYPLPCIAVDLGTACTFDLVVAEPSGPRFVGGAISPGLHTAARALAEHTARLPELSRAALYSPPVPGAMGQHTEQAIHAGLIYGFEGMIRGILDEMAHHLGQKPGIVLTGGDTALWASTPPWADNIDSTLTIKGILSLAHNKCTFFVSPMQN